jgi:sugar/nucleoside kinase (ribokinase family)
LRNEVIIVETKRTQGCKVYLKDEIKTYPGFKVKCIDPTGAGDAFTAGFIYGYLNGWGLDKICGFANAMGAIATTEYGARGKLVTKEDVFAFLREQGVEY